MIFHLVTQDYWGCCLIYILMGLMSGSRIVMSEDRVVGVGLNR